MPGAAAVAATIGVVDSTNPGATIQTLPFSDAFTRSDGLPGQPWYVPGCTPLKIVGGKLSPSAVQVEQAGLFLDHDDFDLTFDVTYSAADSNRDDVQVAFRTDACLGDDYYLWATEPNVSLGGTDGVTLYRHSAASGFVVVAFTSLGIVEGSSHTMRIHVHAGTCNVYMDGGPPFMTAAVDLLPGQRGLHFIATHPGTTIDNVALTVSGNTSGTLVFSDDFTRADSSTSAAGSWTTVRGVAGIDTDQYKPVSGTAPASGSDPDHSAECVSLIDVGQVDGQVEYDFAAGGASQLDFFVAASSDGYTGVDVICSIAANTIYVFERANGPGFTLNTSAAQSGMGSGTHSITIIKNGSNLKVYYDTALKITATLANTYTGTRIGPRVNCALTGFGGARYDNVNVSTL